MQRYTVYFIWKLLYMFRVVPPPIIRSANNCIYGILYLSHRYCHLPLSAGGSNGATDLYLRLHVGPGIGSASKILTFSSSTTLNEGFPCFFLICKANARGKLAKTGHAPHSSKLVVICVVRLLLVLFYVLFVCKYVLYHCHRVATQLKGKEIPLQPWTGPEDSRRLRLPDFKTVGT